MLSVKVTITGDKQVLSKIKKLGQSLYTYDLAMKSIGKKLTSYFGNEVFASQGGALGEKWPSLKPATIKRKNKMNIIAGSMPLVGNNSPHMKDQFEYNAGSSFVVISNAADYFAYHQSNEPRRKLPRRVMMKTTPEVRAMVKDIIDSDIKNKLSKAGL